MGRGQYQKSAAHGRALSVALQGNENGKLHGECTRVKRSPECVAWQNMRGRCLRPSHPSYSRYGGRGIFICPEWDSFERFLADVGRRPGAEYSIDRIDNQGGYEPSNVRWATVSQQATNRRNRCLPGCSCGKHTRGGSR